MARQKKTDDGMIHSRTIFTGDNLYIMRGIRSNSIDMIYLDPPFNSKHNYGAPIGSEAAGAAFKDTWALKDIDLEWWGEINEANPGLYKILDAVKLVHGKSMMSYTIYMAVRLIEMHRILKPTGSLYLHCDPTAGHYLKLILDSLFGQKNFRNDITWKRFSSHNDGKRYGKISDTILFYTKSGKYTWNKIYTPYSEEYIKKEFKNTDERGRYMHRPLTAEGLAGGGFRYVFHGHDRVWKRPKKSMLALEKQGRIHFPKKRGGIPRYKIYLSEAKGLPLQNIWTDIPNVSGKEDTGYPTQKPLALLERIIKASTGKDDVVFDPFCGCATTCLAAEYTDRKWIGIDISAKAAQLIKSRMIDAASIRDKKGAKIDLMDKFTKGAGQIITRTDYPRQNPQKSPCLRNKLYGEQEGICNGCLHHFHLRHMEEDHKIPKADGGQDIDNNIQLLCGNCNRIKGKRTMQYLKARLRELGILPDRD